MSVAFMLYNIILNLDIVHECDKLWTVLAIVFSALFWPKCVDQAYYYVPMHTNWNRSLLNKKYLKDQKHDLKSAVSPRWGNRISPPTWMYTHFRPY